MYCRILLEGIARGESSLSCYITGLGGKKSVWEASNSWPRYPRQERTYNSMLAEMCDGFRKRTCNLALGGVSFIVLRR